MTRSHDAQRIGRDLFWGLLLFTLANRAALSQISAARPMPSTVTVHVAQNGTERIPPPSSAAFWSRSAIPSTTASLRKAW